MNNLFSGTTLFILSTLLFWVGMIPFCWSIEKTMHLVPKEKRQLPNFVIWLFLIPKVSIVFQWMMLPFGIPNGLKNMFSGNTDLIKKINSLKNIGMSLQILSTICMISAIFNYFFKSNVTITNINAVATIILGIPILILWIMYWKRIVNFRKEFILKP